MINKLRMGAAGAVFAAALAGTPAFAADNADATATAEILESIDVTLVSGTSLDFGAMVVTGAGTVSLDASTGNLDCSDADIVCSGATDIAEFSVDTASDGRTLQINLPSSVNLLRAGGTAGNAADELVLDGFNSDAAYDAVNDEYTLVYDASGTNEFAVAGDLTFDGSEGPGVYNGTFNVSVEYN